MQTRIGGADTPDEAVSAGSHPRTLGRQRGDLTVLLVAGAVSWLVQNALMVAAVLPVVPPVLEGSELPATTIQWALTVYGVAVVYGAAGAGAFALGLISGAREPTGAPGTGSDSETSRSVIGTRRIGTFAGIVFLACAAVSGVGAATLLPLSVALPATIPTGPVGLILVSWVLGSAILALAAAVYSWYLYRRQVETSDFERFRDPGLMIYALWNFGGSVLVAVPLSAYVYGLAVAGARSLTNVSSHYLPLVGAVGLLIGPILGIVVFSLLLHHLFRSGRPRRLPEASPALRHTAPSERGAGP